MLKTYPLHEASPDSFGAICGGEATIFLEPQALGEWLHIFGGGHCGQALARLAMDCGWHVTLVDDRPDTLKGGAANVLHEGPAAGYIASRAWRKNDAAVLVARNFHLDRAALAALLAHPGAGYLGMMGSKKKYGPSLRSCKPKESPQRPWPQFTPRWAWTFMPTHPWRSPSASLRRSWLSCARVAGAVCGTACTESSTARAA